MKERPTHEDRTFEKKSKIVPVPKRTRENCVCGQQQLMKPQGMGTHWAVRKVVSVGFSYYHSGTDRETNSQWGNVGVK